MASLACKRSCSLSSARPVTAQKAPRRVLVVRAVETEEAEVGDKSTYQNTGFVSKDTAGQSNMYPVVSRPYEAGSGADITANDGATTNAVALAGALAAAALFVVSLGALTTSGDGSVAPEGNVLTLSEYSQKFSSELGL